MDYEFSIQFDEVTAIFSMGHEAVGQWFTEELGQNLDKIDSLLQQVVKIEKGQAHQAHIHGHSLQLEISRFGVQLSHINEDRSLDDLDEDDDSELYEQESNAECGLADFIEALSSWREYILSL